MTLRMYVERKGWELTSISVDVRYDITDDEPGAIQPTITVPADLLAERRVRSADIAERTPVTLAVRGGTPITTTCSGRTTPAEGRPGRSLYGWHARLVAA